jgi:hypothetical protein
MVLGLGAAHASAARRFALEAAAAAPHHQPHVVRMFDHGVTSDGRERGMKGLFR